MGFRVTKVTHGLLDLGSGKCPMASHSFGANSSCYLGTPNFMPYWGSSILCKANRHQKHPLNQMG